jgi:protease-4
MSKFFTYLSNILLLLVFLQIAPSMLKDIRKKYEDILEPATKVGLITIKDTLTNSVKYTKSLRKCFEDDDIKAILLRLDCPGGYAGTAQSIYNEILTLKKQCGNKPVVALVENIAASGGYYIACATDYIVTPASAFVGSIGAYIALPQVKALIEKYNIKYDIIKSGTYKAAGSPFLDLTLEQRQQFQSLTDSSYQQFIKDVKARRPQLPADTKKWAEGQIFTGEQAYSLKLVDELGSFSAAVKALCRLAKIEGKIDWIRPAKSTSIWSSLLSSDSDDESDDSILHIAVQTFCNAIEQRYAHCRMQ